MEVAGLLVAGLLVARRWLLVIQPAWYSQKLLQQKS